MSVIGQRQQYRTGLQIGLEQDETSAVHPVPLAQELSCYGASLRENDSRKNKIT